MQNSYAYFIGEVTEDIENDVDAWTDVGNVDSLRVEGLPTQEAANSKWRVNSNWVGSYVTAGGYIGSWDLHTNNTSAIGITFETLNNRVIVADRTDRGWYVYEPNGNYVSAVTQRSFINAINSVAFNPNNNDLIFNSSQTNISSFYRFNLTGTYRGSPGGSSVHPDGAVYDTVSNAILAGDNNTIQVWTLNETWTSFVGGQGTAHTLESDGDDIRIRGLTIDTTRQRIIALSDRVINEQYFWYEYDMEFNYLDKRQLFIPTDTPNFNNWEGIAFDPVNEEILALESNTNTVQRYSI